LSRAAAVSVQSVCIEALSRISRLILFGDIHFLDVAPNVTQRIEGTNQNTIEAGDFPH
jgi:hypothetical protein